MPYLKNRKLQDLIEYADTHVKENLPLVLFKYPYENRINAIFQNDSQLITTTDFSECGFVFSPFGNDLPSVLLRKDEMISSDLEEQQPPIGLKAAKPVNRDGEAERYKELVSKAIETIKRGRLQKVVLSRKMEVETSKSALEIFLALLSNYASAYCYCWHHPEIGTWVGATPEILLHFKGDSFTTIALAGTIEKSGLELPRWQQKEKDEQQLVTTYISEVLEGQGVVLDRTQADTVDAGSLWHLKTTLTGRAAPGQVSKILKAMHPTPAVCGLPLAESRQYILENEGYPRRYYTGFLGELDLRTQGVTRLYVNLRCLELTGNKALIYIGGGVTKDSDPDREWEETVAKSQTMLRVV